MSFFGTVRPIVSVNATGGSKTPIPSTTNDAQAGSSFGS